MDVSFTEATTQGFEASIGFKGSFLDLVSVSLQVLGSHVDTISLARGATYTHPNMEEDYLLVSKYWGDFFIRGYSFMQQTTIQSIAGLTFNEKQPDWRSTTLMSVSEFETNFGINAPDPRADNAPYDVNWHDPIGAGDSLSIYAMNGVSAGTTFGAKFDLTIGGFSLNLKGTCTWNAGESLKGTIKIKNEGTSPVNCEGRCLRNAAGTGYMGLYAISY